MHKSLVRKVHAYRYAVEGALPPLHSSCSSHKTDKHRVNTEIAD